MEPIAESVQTNRKRPSETSAALFLFNQPAAPAGDVWSHDLYEDTPAYAAAGRPMEIQTGTKLFISNLDYNVSNDDIKVRVHRRIIGQGFELGIR